VATLFHLLQRDVVQARPAYAVMRCVCPSVRPSVTFVNSVKKSNHMFSPSGSQTILVFLIPNVMAVFRWEPHNGGVECRWGKHKSRVWTNSWLSIDDCWTCEQQLQRTTMQFIAQTATQVNLCLTQPSRLQHGRIHRKEENRTEQNCTQR